MAKFTVEMATKVRNFTFKGRDGEDVAMVEYQLVVVDEAGAKQMPKLARSGKKDAPQPGDEINGTLENSEKFGLSLKEDRAAGNGGFRGGGKSPEERAEVIRQNALTAAVAYVTAKAGFMEREGAIKYLEAKHIVQVATYFAKFSKGDVTIVMDVDQVASTFGYDQKETTAEPFQAPAPSQPHEDNSLPFDDGEPEEVV